MSADIVIKGGIVVTPSGEMQGGIAIADGKIVAVGPNAALPSGKQEINADGKIIFPGLFDPHVHLGLSEKTFSDDSMEADFKIDTRDCLIGGVTTIATTTLIGKDPLQQYFDRALRCGQGHSWVDFKITSVVNTLEQARQIPGIVKKHGVSFKFFTGYAGEQAEGFGMSKEGITPGLFHEACAALAQAGPPAYPMIHAEDPYVRGILVDEMRKLGRKDFLTAWAETSPEWAESVQVYTYGHIANKFRLPLYPVHVSAAHTVETIKSLHQMGLPIIGETVSAFLCTTAPEMDAKGMAAKAKIQPPIRFQKDRDRLWQGIKDGTITVIGTDSLTYSSQFKEQDFWECRVGLNLQVADTLPLVFDEGYNQRRLDLVTLAKVLSENAARVYGIYPKKGAIIEGADADVVVIDPDKEAILGKHRSRGRQDYSMWEGRKVKGMPVMTFLRGNLMMKDGEIATDKMLGQHVIEAL